MTIDYYATWRQDRLGTASLIIGGTTVSISTGWLSHGVDATLSGEAITSFQDALANAIATAGVTGVSVGFSLSTLRYTITSTPARTLDFAGAGTAGALMAQLLGFANSTFGSATSFVGTVRPYYVIRTQLPTRVDPSGIYEVETTARRVSDTGYGYAVSPTTVQRAMSLEHHFEPIAAVFSDRASASAPWTWQHFFEHCGRYQEPILSYGQPYVAAEDSTLWQLITPNFTRDVRERQVRGLDAYWRVKLQLSYLARY